MAEITDLELALEWVKFYNGTVGGTQEKALAELLARVRLDEAKCMYENWNVDESIRSFDAWARNRIAALEQAAGGSAAAKESSK